MQLAGDARTLPRQRIFDRLLRERVGSRLDARPVGRHLADVRRRAYDWSSAIAIGWRNQRSNLP